MKPQVLYVVGYGRSGSTVLDTVLAAHPRVQGVGELTNLVRSGWVNRELCACGEPGDHCEFWSAVRDTWERLVPDLDLEAHQRRGRTFDRPQAWWLRTARLQSRALRRYRMELQGLYQAIAEVSGAEWIVDSSKLPGRAAVLLGMEGIDLRLLHLVRDGRGVAWSLRKAFQKNLEAGVQHDIRPLPVWRTALLWNAVNRFAERLTQQAGPASSLRIRYEDFVSEPASALAEVTRRTGLNFEPVAARLAADEAIGGGHAIAGNRVRMAGPLRLRADTEWKSRLPLDAQRRFQRIAGRTLRRYGYEV